jgi:hexulose-6-phosphate isomerase
MCPYALLCAPPIWEVAQLRNKFIIALRMKSNLSRRDFLATSTAIAAGLGLGLGAVPGYARQTAPAFKTKLHKALIVGKPAEDELKRFKDAGFDGVEAGIVPPQEAEACRKVAEKCGMRVHSVLRGWAEFNSDDPSKVEKTFAVTEDALRAAQGYGAETVLLVPCRIGGMKMPTPRQFAIEFDPKTNHLTRVVAGDNAPYDDYIKAHNHAIDTSREAVKRLIPLAEKCGVVIALENVWNNLWVQPPVFQNFVASFNNPWVKAYLDIGNHVKYAPPEEWILTLGSLVAKCHVKDFKLSEADPGTGKFVDIRDGSVRWPAVRAALEKIGYNGWMTIEGGGLSTEENSKRLDLIIAGK